MSAFDKNDPAFQDLLIECMKSTKVFAKTFFPEEVEAEFSILHDDVFRVFDGPKKRKAAAAPRGLGKTTLAKIKVCKAVVFRETNFIIYLSNSATSAEEQTEHIKIMLQSPRIQEIFGDIKTSYTKQKETFSKKAWVAFGDIFVLPRGAGQQVRGQNWRGHRPGLIVIDDLEDTELVRSEEQRQKLKTWFFADLMKTESRYSEPAEFIYIDTIKHQDSLLQNLIDSSDWDTVVISICDANFNSYDPNYMTTEELKQEYEEHKEAGETDLFYMERMNIAISLKDAIFKPEYNKYFEEANGFLKVVEDGKTSLFKVADMITFVICDPAKTVKMHSAESAVLTISVDRTSGKIFYRSIYSGKVRPDELYDIMFAEVLLFNAMMLCVEVTGLNEFISQPIENQMRTRCLYPQFIQLHAKGDKLMRISTMEPNYRLGYMYHNRQSCTELENQLQWFPKSKLLDVVDAASYINHIMDEHAIYFDPSDDEHDPDDEFDELEDEMPQTNWRTV